MKRTPDLSDRLKRLPGELLLALVNASALLVIIACILVIVMLNRVDHVGGRIAETVTEATLAKLEITPATLKERLKSVDARLEALLDRLEVADIREDKAIATQIAELNGNLKRLNSSAAIIGFCRS
ncbi:hypothetical protein ABVF61_16395 [Roseibium sp. HPY-6]|uniref:hypothetical protein n=1 Tax=Roseibium sp. HPY-6 TaxID=3229852 RepID=UPI00338F9A47